jgi:DNA-binding MarR family transcriptional regulator
VTSMAATVAVFPTPNKQTSQKTSWTVPVRCHSDFAKQYLRKLTGCEAKLLLALASFWSRKEPAPFPSQAVLAQLIGYSERQVQRALRALIGYGLITVEARAQGKGNRYHLLPEGEASCG